MTLDFALHFGTDLMNFWTLNEKTMSRCSNSMQMKLNMSDASRRLWGSMNSLTGFIGQQYKAAVVELKESVFELRIMKGELKHINKLLNRKRGELASEVQYATRNVQLAYDERTSCKRLYAQMQNQWKQVSGALCQSIYVTVAASPIFLNFF